MLKHLFACVLSLIATSVAMAVGQEGPPRLNPFAFAVDDGKRSAELVANGTRDEGAHVILWTPAGALSTSERKALITRLDLGLAELRRLVGTHEWQTKAVKNERITFYVHADRFIAHATAGRAAVFIPLERLQDGRAPLLHEAAHELLAHSDTAQVIAQQPPELEPLSRILPEWLLEGLASYLGFVAAAQSGTVEGDVFDIGGVANSDQACATRLAGAAGKDVLPVIGGLGRLAKLYTTERQAVAPTFYACATSFTKYVVERIGLSPTVMLMTLIPQNGVHSRIEELSGEPMATLRTKWLRTIQHKP